MTDSLWIVTTTVATQEEARKLARTMVEERLAACAQWEDIRSVFRWQGEIEDASEVRIVFKTTAQCWPALRDRILHLHPYEVPALYGFPAVGVHHGFAEWVAQNTGDAGPCMESRLAPQT
ncbi:divalent-cation tolerance protein CutA [Candidatus Symbiobacter mobilis]|uniref:Periplasmic divalent cation tolerance protein n=1 Tax=Candidatus Symbiobacter mobilis CR TaxID=946483 RepID=U5N691_9BURK|nr:divalent-cation tolerance protein CutA [Candidatus Symbiobacter mobilis]AGX86872.1 periplasmic divalent cation tolerance protein [Candidatus Symbiobacter mobilis CR]